MQVYAVPACPVLLFALGRHAIMDQTAVLPPGGLGHMTDVHAIPSSVAKVKNAALQHVCTACGM